MTEHKNIVIVVDDERLFEDYQKRFNDDAHVYYCRTAEVGVALIKSYKPETKINKLFLDHDLGIAGDVRPVVRYLEEVAVNGNPANIDTIYIHTANPIAKEYIRQALQLHYNCTIINAVDYGLYA